MKKSEITFVQRTVPPEAEPTAREMYLAAHPDAARLQRAQLEEIRSKLAALMDGLKPMLSTFVNKAENARQIGIVLLELTDTLPGKRLTRDFYEQMRHEFVDATGRILPFELLEWFMRCARGNQEPIGDIFGALKWNQPLLLATGDAEFQLEQENVLKRRIEPLDELGKIQNWFEKSDIVQSWQGMKKNPRYFPNGHIREDLRAMLAEEFGPQIAVVEEIKQELGL